MNRDKKAAEATWGMFTSSFFVYVVLPNQFLLQISKPASEPNQRKFVLHLLLASQLLLLGLENQVRYLTAPNQSFIHASFTCSYRHEKIL